MKRGEPGVLDETPWLTSQDGANLTSGLIFELKFDFFYEICRK